MVKQEEVIRSKSERRNIISSVFVSVLIGLAFQEMVPPVRNSVRAAGITLETTVFFIIFFLTSMRFFIGNQLHLISDGLLKMKGIVWFYDLIWIIIQTTLLIFLGGVASVEASRPARINFIYILILLYAADVVWIISQWMLGEIFEKISQRTPKEFFQGWRRDFIPYKWAILNSLLIISMTVVYYFTGDLYSKTMLIWMLILNVVAFVFDVVITNYFDLI